MQSSRIDTYVCIYQPPAPTAYIAIIRRNIMKTNNGAPKIDSHPTYTKLPPWILNDCKVFMQNETKYATIHEHIE